MKKYIIFGSIGFELVGLILGCYYIGIELDKKYHSKGMIFAVLSLLVLCGWLFRVIWMLRRMQKQEEKENPETSSAQDSKSQ